MKLTVAEVVNSYNALVNIGKEKLPAKGGYWIARLVKKLEPEFATAEAQRVVLVREFGEPTEDGGVRVANGKAVQFSEKWVEVLKQEIEVDCPKIKLDMLGDSKIGVADMVAIEKFVEE